MTEEADTLSTQAFEIGGLRAELIRRINIAESRYLQLQSQLDTKEEDWTRVSRQNEEEKNTLQTDNQNLKKAKVDLEKVKADLEKAKADLENEKVDLENQNTTSRKKTDKTENQNKKLKVMIQQLYTELKRTVETVEALYNIHLQSKSSSSSSSSSSSRDSGAPIQELINTSKESLRVADSIMAGRIDNKSSSPTGEITTFAPMESDDWNVETAEPSEFPPSAITDIITSLNKKKQEIQSDIEAGRSQMSSLQLETNKIEADLANMQSTKNSIMTDIDALKVQIQSFRDLYTSAESNYRTQTAALDEQYQAKNNDYQTRTAALDEQYQAKNNDLTSIITTIQVKINEAQIIDQNNLTEMATWLWGIQTFNLENVFNNLGSLYLDVQQDKLTKADIVSSLKKVGSSVEIIKNLLSSLTNENMMKKLIKEISSSSKLDNSTRIDPPPTTVTTRTTLDELDEQSRKETLKKQLKSATGYFGIPSVDQTHFDILLQRYVATLQAAFTSARDYDVEAVTNIVDFEDKTEDRITQLIDAHNTRPTVSTFTDLMGVITPEGMSIKALDRFCDLWQISAKLQESQSIKDLLLKYHQTSINLIRIISSLMTGIKVISVDYNKRKPVEILEGVAKRKKEVPEEDSTIDTDSINSDDASTDASTTDISYTDMKNPIESTSMSVGTVTSTVDVDIDTIEPSSSSSSSTSGKKAPGKKASRKKVSGNEMKSMLLENILSSTHRSRNNAQQRKEKGKRKALVSSVIGEFRGKGLVPKFEVFLPPPKASSTSCGKISKMSMVDQCKRMLERR